MDKRVYFESASPIHLSQYNLINYPPEGYTFVTGDSKLNNFLVKLIKHDTLDFGLRECARVLPLGLIRPYFKSLMKQGKESFDLVYSYNQLVFRKVPWVVWVEWINFLVGRHMRLFWQYRNLVENLLASSYCKAILTWAEMTMKNILYNLDCRRFEDKIEVVFPAVPRRNFVKRYNNDKVKLLFVGSGRSPILADFHTKGGKEVLKMFTLLCKGYHNIELVMRVRIPPRLKGIIRRYENIRLIEEVVPWKVLKREFETADILIHPTHFALNTVVIDALSYELPIVITDVYNYPEWVEDGVTGFLIKSPKDVPYFWKNFIPSGPTPVRHLYDKGVRTLQQTTVKQLVEKVSILIEDESLRRRMGKAARREVEEGKFSIQRRNEKLKRVFDKALL